MALVNNAAAMGAGSGMLGSVVREAKGYLQSHPAEVDIELNPGYVPDALERTEKLCRRFHRVVLELRQRRADRPTFDVKDEYDVQDLFRALLAVEFDDVRAEDPASQQAGASSRIDFVIPGDDLVVEVKMTREGLADKKIGEQLLIAYSPEDDRRFYGKMITDSTRSRSLHVSLWAGLFPSQRPSFQLNFN